MSTINADALSPATGTNTNLALTGKGTGFVTADTIKAATSNGNLTLAGNGSGGVVLTGNVTNATLPAFLAYNSATDANVTGNATVATVDFDTEVFDQGGDFATDTFTAPVTGRYLLCAAVRWLNATAAADLAEMIIVTSNHNFHLGPAASNDIWTNGTLNLTVIADMDAADTATVTFRVSGEASDVVDIFGGGDPRTSFSGCLLA